MCGLFLLYGLFATNGNVGGGADLVFIAAVAFVALTTLSSAIRRALRTDRRQRMS